jgi:predicted nucleic acid-binding protein
LPSGETALCDTGPLVAIIDSNDTAHLRCRAELGRLGGSLVTTWPVLSESFYLLRKQHLRELLWQFILGGGIEVADPTSGELPRIRSLMARYADLPMDFADATLVVLGERLNVRRVLTIDRRDFRIYRPKHASVFEIFP